MNTNASKSDDKLDGLVATAALGIDTLWGGDVMNPSGTGRFIADSWFSDAPLPPAYQHPLAARLRQLGGIALPPQKAGLREAVAAYTKEVDVLGAIRGVQALAQAAPLAGTPRGAYLRSLADCFAVMWDLAQELLEQGPHVPYRRCVETMTGAAPEPSQPEQKRQLLRELLGLSSGADLPEAVSLWRQARLVPRDAIAAVSARCIAEYDALTVRNLLPYLPEALRGVPRANVQFLPITDAWFSGSMNYLGRARTPDGRPLYEATYELNAALTISLPEFQQLVTHEVVPGHVTTFAYLQDLHHRGLLGFEASVLTMNTRSAVLFEGIANNAILMAHGVREVHELPDRDLQIGVLLALLQDDAKNQASYLTWQEGLPQAEVAAGIRDPFLLSAERADKLSGAWGRHPLLGRMYLPAYRAGTELVADLRRRYPAEQVLPALYGARGLVDSLTLQELLKAEAA